MKEIEISTIDSDDQKDFDDLLDQITSICIGKNRELILKVFLVITATSLTYFLKESQLPDMNLKRAFVFRFANRIKEDFIDICEEMLTKPSSETQEDNNHGPH